MSFSKKITDLKREVLKESEPLFAHIEDVAEANTLKVLDAMRECLAPLLGLPVTRVSVKATTTEKLGFVGRKEGCEVWATVLIFKI